ncbi:MAG: hypothetical protein WCC39_06830 [Telluria sp.]
MFHDLMDRAEANGNAISEFDNFYKLAQIDPRYCKDVVRGYFGRTHGDWKKANEQAETSVQLLEAMSKRELGFREAYKAQKQIRRGGPADAPVFA